MLQALVLDKSNSTFTQSSLKNNINFVTVTSIPALKKQLFKKEFDFVFISEQDALSLMRAFLAVFELDKELPIITHDSPKHYKTLPQTQNLYFVPLRVTINHIEEVLSFHKAKTNNELQATYPTCSPKNNSPLNLTQHSPLGILLTDAEESIFYANKNAETFLKTSDKTRLIKDYLPIHHTIKNQPHTEIFEFVHIPQTGMYINIYKQTITQNKNTLGHLYFLEDASKKHKQEKKIKAQKEKYEKLTGRLNEAMLHEIDTRAYNESYFKRKLDLEIKHAHKDIHDVHLFYFALPELNHHTIDVHQNRTIITQTTRFLLEKFPDPYILGHITEGHWLIIGMSDLLHISSNIEAITKELNTFIKDLSKTLKIKTPLKIKSNVITNLKGFKNSDEVLEAVL